MNSCSILRLSTKGKIGSTSDNAGWSTNWERALFEMRTRKTRIEGVDMVDLLLLSN